MIAFLYSSIGFGGGSSYLAILVLYGIEYTSLHALALLCNIAVVSFGVYCFSKHNYIDWKKAFPLVILSVPFAFIGGSIFLPKQTFLLVLGVTLLIAGIIILIKKSFVKIDEVNSKSSNIGQMGIGGGIGFLSGLVGIGGGIFLSPLLYLLHWDTPKRIAATASLFILVNSNAGLLGQYSQHDYDLRHLY